MFAKRTISHFYMKNPNCPRCDGNNITKSGVINEKQRFKCKDCNYNFTVEKMGKGISTYYVIKALQLYIEGVSYRDLLPAKIVHSHPIQPGAYAVSQTQVPPSFYVP